MHRLKEDAGEALSLVPQVPQDLMPLCSRSRLPRGSPTPSPVI